MVRRSLCPPTACSSTGVNFGQGHITRSQAPHRLSQDSESVQVDAQLVCGGAGPGSRAATIGRRHPQVSATVNDQDVAVQEGDIIVLSQQREGTYRIVGWFD